MEKRVSPTSSRQRRWLRRAALSLSLSLAGGACRETSAPVEPPAQPPAPIPAAADTIPEPPPLAKDATDCSVRRWNSHDTGWRQQAIRHDPTTRTVIIDNGEPRRFDAAGRLVTLGENSQVYAYDAHGNLSEWTAGQSGGVRRGTRWVNRYEGEPARTVERQASHFADEGGSRLKPSSRLNYRYGADGLLAEETRQDEGSSSLWTRTFRWTDGRLAAIESVHTPRTPGTALAYDAVERFVYDAQGRLSEYVRDGHARGARAADGRPDSIARYRYDSDGRLARFEQDGRTGDVRPAAPDGKPDAIALFSAPCATVVDLLPALFHLPDPMLPATVPRWH